MNNKLITQNIVNPVLDPSVQNLSGTQFFSNLARSGISIVFAVGATFFIFYFLYGGVLWISSEGDQSKLQRAKSTLLNAMVGLLILTGTWAIAKFIETTFGVSIININLQKLVIGSS